MITHYFKNLATNRFLSAIVLTFVGIVMSANVSAQGFTISGKINGQDNKLIFLNISVSPWKLVKDSTKIVNGEFTFKGEVGEPAPTVIKLGEAWSGLNLFLDNADLKIDAGNDLVTAHVSGSKENDLYTSFNIVVKPNLVTDEDIDLYSKYEKEKDNANLKKITALLDDKETKSIATVKDFITKNPDSKTSAYILIVYLGELPYQELNDVYIQLTARIKDSGYGKYIQRMLAKAKKTAIGEVAEDFAQNDASGTPVHLSSFKGKYVLVDFWASWCVPCRLANKHLVVTYQKYKSKGFDILGVAAEQPDGKPNWLKAIKDDQLVWANVSDFKYLKNDAAVQYGINNIPSNLLLDREGKIIGKNLSADELDKKLAELMN